VEAVEAGCKRRHETVVCTRRRPEAAGMNCNEPLYMLQEEGKDGNYVLANDVV